MRGTCGDRDVEFKEGNSFESDLEANQNQKYCSVEQSDATFAYSFSPKFIEARDGVDTG